MKGEKPFIVSIDPTLIPTDQELNELNSLEDVLVVGYPNGIIDNSHNIPVFRRGITATPVYIDFNNNREFLIDAAIFPGSGRSPMMLFNQGTWGSREGGVMLGTRAKLLGIVYGVMTDNVNGDISIPPAPTQAPRAVVNSKIPNNLGVCVMASRILEFEPVLGRNGVTPPEGYKMRAGGNIP